LSSDVAWTTHPLSYLLQQEEYQDSELDDIAQALQRAEFYDLTPTHKIHVLFVMCNEIFKTGTFNAAIQENIDRTTQLRFEDFFLV
jgi:hypothetical protein